MRWDLEALKTLVRNKQGADVVTTLEPLLNSVGRKFELARYHSIESRRLIDQYFGDDEFENYNKAIRFIFDRVNKDEEALQFFQDAFIAEANIVAYSHAVHSVFDIIGQLLIISLNIGSLFTAKEPVYLSTVRDRMSKRGIADGVVTEINNASECESFKYLNAFVNTNKHRCLVTMPYIVSMDATEKVPYGIRIDSFTYKDHAYDQKWAGVFVTDEYLELSERIVGIGNSINSYLQN